MKILITFLLAIFLAACAGPALDPEDSTTTPNDVPSTNTPAEPEPTMPPPEDEAAPEEASSPGEPVIVLHKEGGFAGIVKTWQIYADGRVVAEDGTEGQIQPDVAANLLDTFEEIGFFEMVPPKTTNICCDHFTYTITVKNDDMENEISISSGDKNMPAGLRAIITDVEKALAEMETT